eukprot:SM000024S07869  [mRNA]  locus=s24:956493:960574:- [translate_table: standard]
MDDPEGSLSFDFEGGLDALAAAAPPTTARGDGGHGQTPQHHQHQQQQRQQGGAPPAAAQRRNYRQTVCRHWLRGLCMKGDACGFLHQLDKARMPICRFYAKWGECHEADCPYKHTFDDVKECNMYKLGFCPNGADCRYRHAKQPGPPPPPEQHLKLLQQRHGHAGVNPAYQQRGQRNWQGAGDAEHVGGGERGGGGRGASGGAAAPTGALQGPGAPSTRDDIGDLGAAESAAVPAPPRAQPAPSRPSQQKPPPPASTQLPNLISISSPLPPGPTRYFVVKSNNVENLELSAQRGLWATHRNNEGKLNDAFDMVLNVLLAFSVNETRHFQGVARMQTRIGAIAQGPLWKTATGMAQYGRNFAIKWLKMADLSFNKTQFLRNPYNDNMPVKVSRDCQEVEPSIGEQLVSLFYSEPDSALMGLAVAAERTQIEERLRREGMSAGGPMVGAAPRAGTMPPQAEEPDGVEGGRDRPADDMVEDDDDEEDDGDEEEDDVEGGEEVSGRPPSSFGGVGNGRPGMARVQGSQMTNGYLPGIGPADGYDPAMMAGGNFLAAPAGAGLAGPGFGAGLRPQYGLASGPGFLGSAFGNGPPYAPHLVGRGPMGPPGAEYMLPPRGNGMYGRDGGPFGSYPANPMMGAYSPFPPPLGGYAGMMPTRPMGLPPRPPYGPPGSGVGGRMGRSMSEPRKRKRNRRGSGAKVNNNMVGGKDPQPAASVPSLSEPAGYVRDLNHGTGATQEKGLESQADQGRRKGDPGMDDGPRGLQTWAVPERRGGDDGGSIGEFLGL